MPRFDFIAAYVLTNQTRSTLYVGVTSDLPHRVSQHRAGNGSVFTAKYNLKRLVWFERYDTMPPAWGRERRLKEWQRQWKIELIEAVNPNWDDLSGELY